MGLLAGYILRTGVGFGVDLGVRLQVSAQIGSFIGSGVGFSVDLFVSGLVMDRESSKLNFSIFTSISISWSKQPKGHNTGSIK